MLALVLLNVCCSRYCGEFRVELLFVMLGIMELSGGFFVGFMGFFKIYEDVRIIKANYLKNRFI